MRLILRLGMMLMLLPANGVLRAEPSPSGNRVSLAGDWQMMPGALEPANLYLPSLADGGWKQIAVPSSWYLQGVDLSGDVWFRRHFSWTKPKKGQVVQLVFEGVDYAADVWLNGNYLGFHEGYFEPFSFDVSRLLKSGNENVLTVLVHSPNEEYGSTWSLHKRLIKGIFNHHDTRPGGAWSFRGQEKNTGGIWAPVYLRISSHVAITSLHSVPRPDSEAAKIASGGRWNVAVQVDVLNPEAEPREVRLECKLLPESFSLRVPSGGKCSRDVTLSPGENQISLSFSSENTQLWWSWDQGSPNLYRLQLKLSEAGTVLDETRETIGFRSIEVLPDTLQWILNGRPVFLRGTNYISSQWLSEMSPERFQNDLGLMKRANINAIRVHAHIEPREFYAACDEAGVLVWQDFPLQWGYAEDAKFENEALRQARGMVAFLGDHASVGAWTMHNEPPWDAPWMKYKYPDYAPTQNKRLDEMLSAAVQQIDPTRYTHDHSSTAEHPWLGWYSGSWQDYAKPAKEPIISEFGAEALPGLPSLRKIFTADELWPDTDAKWAEWDYHNFQKHENFDLAKVSMGLSIDEFIRNSQEYQSKVVQFAAESYRRQRFQPVTAIFQFMFVEDWPSVNWGVVDYWRNPKPGYRALATAYQPVLPSIVWTKESWAQGELVSLPLWIVNDLPDAFPGSRLFYRLHNDSADFTDVQSIDLDIEPSTAREATVLERKDLAPGSYDLAVWIEDAQKVTLGRNQFRFRILESAEK